MDALVDDPVLGLCVACTTLCLLLSVIGVLMAWEIKERSAIFRRLAPSTHCPGPWPLALRDRLPPFSRQIRYLALPAQLWPQ
jgi:hypothetical protein